MNNVNGETVMEIYIPILYGRYPEDGEKVLDGYKDEKKAEKRAEEELETSHYTNSSVLERELHE